MEVALTRELPRLPDDAPKVIAPKVRELLTQLMFRTDSFGPTDVLFCFCTNSHYEIQAEVITDFLDRGYTKNVVISGGRANYTDVVGEILTESLEVMSYFDVSRYPSVNFVLETASKNTYENVTFSMQKFDFSKCRNLTFSSQAFAAGRSYLTLKKFFPHLAISQYNFKRTFDITHPQSTVTIGATTWHLSEIGIKHVWGEYLRICRYGARGDIALTPEVQSLLTAIASLHY